MVKFLYYIGTFFLNFGVRHVASQRFFLRKTICLCFFRPNCHFSVFFRIKKDAHWNLAKTGPKISPWTLIFDHFVQFCRLQLKRGLFWYRHYPKLHQMVKYRSSQADFGTNLRQISMRVFFASKKCENMTTWSKKHKHFVFHETSDSHQSWKTQMFR